MVDIHSHILPGVDDGPQSLEESVAMVQLAAENGTTDIVATPHANIQFQFEPHLIVAKVEELRKASGNVVRIHQGCDFHLSYDNITDALEHPGKYCINQKRYILVEFSDFLIPQTIDEVFYRMRSARMTPIITHPERNMLLQKQLEALQRWTNAGCLVQVTAQSLLGRFGKQAKSFAEHLLKHKLVHFIASDGHDTRHRPPVLSEGYEYVLKHYGEQRANALFVSNPLATLTGEELDIDDADTDTQPKKWYQFWA